MWDRSEYMKQYCIDHREEKRAYDAAYEVSHREEKRAYRDSHRDAFRKRQRQKCAEFTEWLQILRSVNGCEDCVTHEGLLEHHHVDPDTKEQSVSHMYTRSLDAMEDELEKCVVLCVPCHKKRHVEMRCYHEQIVA